MTRVDNSAITKLKCPNCQTVNKRNAAALDFTCASCETKFCLVCNVRYHEKMNGLELKKLVLKKKFEQEEKVPRTNDWINDDRIFTNLSMSFICNCIKNGAKMVSVLTYAKTGRRAIQRIINVRVNRLLGVLLVNGLHTRIPMFVATWTLITTKSLGYVLNVKMTLLNAWLADLIHPHATAALASPKASTLVSKP